MNSPETRTKIRLTWWPSPQDYNEAVQTPGLTFTDPMLRKGSPEITALGLPRPITGNFASVYKFDCGSKDYAVRCFLRNIPGQRERYEAISLTLKAANDRRFLRFEYLDEAIELRGDKFPLLRMQWVNGWDLTEYIRMYLEQPHRLATLAEQIKGINLAMREYGIAHGDLQHGNIIVEQHQILLVDYDGMYVPDFEGQPSSELGHRNYQHPQRSADDFDERLDNFSAWVIYISLVALSMDSSLWARLEGGNECLLFREADFRDPLRSKAFHAFENHRSERIQNMGRFLRSLLDLHPLDAPYLDAEMEPPADLAPLTVEPIEIPELVVPSVPFQVPMKTIALVLFCTVLFIGTVIISIALMQAYSQWSDQKAIADLQAVARKQVIVAPDPIPTGGPYGQIVDRAMLFQNHADSLGHSNHFQAERYYREAIKEYLKLPVDYIQDTKLSDRVFHSYDELAHCLRSNGKESEQLDCLREWKREAVRLGASSTWLQQIDMELKWAGLNPNGTVQSDPPAQPTPKPSRK